MKLPILTSLLLVAGTHVVHAEPDCPDAFRGAAISSSQIRDGVSLTFQTDAGKVHLMREQLRELAMMIEQKGTEVQTASYEEEVEFPPLDIDVKDIGGGAKVSVRASRPRDLPELRELASSFQRYWDSSTCHGNEIAKTPAPQQPARKAQPRRAPSRQARR